MTGPLGAITHACYGLTGIPGEWLKKLAKRDLIEGLAAKLSAAPE